MMIPKVDQLSEIRDRMFNEWWDANQDSLVRRIIESVLSNQYEFPVWRPGWDKFGGVSALDQIESRLRERFATVDKRYSITILREQRFTSNTKFIWVSVRIEDAQPSQRD